MHLLRRWLGLTALAGALGIAGAMVWCDARVRAYLAGPPLGATRIYSAPTVLRAGDAPPDGSLVRKLTRLGYAESAPDAALEPGTFRASPTTVEIAQRPSPEPWAAGPRHVRVGFARGRITALRDAGGSALDRLELEPEVLAVLGGGAPTLGPGAEVPPPACRNAVLAAEDRHFFRHPGVDPTAIVRAFWTDLRAGARAQGGSTITQQLAKNAFLTPRRTLGRKIEEAVLAILLEVRSSKEEILQRYLASVYLGADGGLPVHGFAQAAELYFGKPLGELGPAQCALLAGMIRSPNALAPRRHPRAALARRNRVLALMERSGLLDREATARAVDQPLGLVAWRPRAVSALYVAVEVARELERILPADVARAPGLSVFTAVDADIQREAERIVRRRLDLLERGRRQGRLQAGLVALDVRSGGVRALVGGRDFGTSQLDRAMRTRRQPGSAFKPFVYLTALDPARRGAAAPRSVVSPLDDEPLTVGVGASAWRPENYDGVFLGRLPLEDALADSRNAATVRLALDVGVEAVARTATDLGIDSPLPRVPALALGAAETSLIELTRAYGVLASGGIRRPSTLLVAVTAPHGATLYAAPQAETRVLTAGVAYLVTHLLERVVDVGTGRGAREAGLTGAAAGKTGTTDDTRDAWFVGYTPALVAGVWVGLDGGGSTGFTGAQAALPIWTDLIRASGGEDQRGFPVPDDIVWRDVDPASGELASANCPEHRHEPFLAGTEPSASCSLHRPLWTVVEQGLGDAGRAVGSGGRRFGSWLGRLFR